MTTAVETEQYIRKPLYVDAVRVDADNFESIAAWTEGTIETDELSEKQYIKIDAHNPKNVRQTKAFVGDWVLKTRWGFKIYTVKAFFNAFTKVEDLTGAREISTEPQASVEAKEQIDIHSVSLTTEEPTGENGIQALVEPDLVPPSPYGVTQKLSETPSDPTDTLLPNKPTISEDYPPIAPPPTPTIVPPIQEEVIEERIETVPATPENIAQAVRENEAAIQASREVEEAVAANGSDKKPENAESITPAAAEGKMVLSLEEQAELGPEGVRELLQSGEAVLVQELAQP